MKLVTEGIDAIAATRVLIRGENSHTSIHAYTGETVHRTFRYGILYIYVCVCARARMCGSSYSWRNFKQCCTS